jgi:hypothetical protein
MRARRSAIIGSVALLVALVAGPAAARSTELAPSHVHFMPPQATGQGLPPAAKGSHGGGGGGGSTNTGIFYHGGPIIQSINVAAIYWGTSTIYKNGPAPGSSSTSGGSDNSLVAYFLSNLGGSSYYNINSTYYDGSNVKVQNAVKYSGFWADNSNPGSTVSDAAIQAEVVAAFANGLPYDKNTVYAVFTASGVNLGGGFGSQYCAYHGDFTATINGVSQVVKYAAMPYAYQYPSGCSALNGSPNNDYAGDTEVNVLAHEVEETNTDPELNAWYDRRGYENADKCAWNFGTTSSGSTGTYNQTLGGVHWMIQMNWVNANSGGCLQHWP